MIDLLRTFTRGKSKEDRYSEGEYWRSLLAPFGVQGSRMHGFPFSSRINFDVGTAPALDQDTFIVPQYFPNASYIQQGGTFNDLGRLAKTEVLFGTFRYNINFDLSSSAAGDECKFELFNMLWAGGVVRQSAFTQHTTERATAGSQLMRFQLQGEHHNVLTSGFWFHCGASGFTFNDSVAHLDFVGYKISIQ